ncbi:GIY-YIG nuclease family protein [Deinococcus yunweiensis]|uniref:GIY-YIG nuclease family protein n=1 Tax=Deinococcus yunweiensis TaxID=367282 RepID=UPI00398F48C5
MVKLFSIYYWRGTPRLIDNVAQGHGGAWVTLRDRLNQGRVNDADLARLIAFDVHAIDQAVGEAPNLTGSNLVTLYARAQSKANPERNLALRPRLRSGLTNLIWEEAQKLLDTGPPEVLYALIHSQWKDKAFEWIRSQNKKIREKYFYCTKLFGNNRYSDELNSLPVDVLFYLTQQNYSSYEQSVKYNIESAFQKALKSVPAKDRHLYDKAELARREAALVVEQRTARIKSTEEAALQWLGKKPGLTLAGSRLQAHLGSTNAAELAEYSENTAILTLLAQAHDTPLQRAFLRRIQAEGQSSPHIPRKPRRLFPQVHEAMATHWEETSLLELAACPGLAQSALVILASSPYVRVRRTVARRMGLQLRDLRTWVAEQTMTTEPVGSPSHATSVQNRTTRSTVGMVYILMNPSMPGLVKIGHSSRNATSRVAELSAPTGVPTPFEVVIERAFDDSAAAEAQLHVTLHAHRVSDSREFFRCDISTAVEALLNLHARLADRR